MSTMYSWPRSLAVAAISSIWRPPSLHVEWRWQSPRSSWRRSAARPMGCIDISAGVGLELRQVGRDLAGERLGHHRGRRRPDALEVDQRAVCARAGAYSGDLGSEGP